jgi:hypothetical protein
VGKIGKRQILRTLKMIDKFHWKLLDSLRPFRINALWSADGAQDYGDMIIIDAIYESEGTRRSIAIE